MLLKRLLEIKRRKSELDGNIETLDDKELDAAMKEADELKKEEKEIRKNERK